MNTFNKNIFLKLSSYIFFDVVVKMAGVCCLGDRLQFRVLWFTLICPLNAL
jgi:hypothetical protein